MPNELIDLALTKAVDKTIPMQYMNKILSNWHAKNITTATEAEKLLPEPSFQSTPKTKKEGWERTYEKQDLDALFDSLEDIEI
jgi:DNA replication protein DnaD